jgi:hypothetical protein
MHSSRRAFFTVTASVTVTRSRAHLGDGRLGHGLCKAGLVGEEGALDLLEGVERGNREVALHGEFASDGLGSLLLLVAVLLLGLLEGLGLLLDRALDEASPGSAKIVGSGPGCVRDGRHLPIQHALESSTKDLVGEAGYPVEQESQERKRTKREKESKSEGSGRVSCIERREWERGKGGWGGLTRASRA